MTWGVYDVEDDANGMQLGVHVVPDDDLREHACTPECWCRPWRSVEDDDMQSPTSLFMHRSMDGREAFETGERVPS